MLNDMGAMRSKESGNNPTLAHKDFTEMIFLSIEGMLVLLGNIQGVLYLCLAEQCL